MDFRFSAVVVNLLILVLASFGVIDTDSFYVSRNTSLVSPGGVFELGFFSSGGDRWYFGIWYKKIPRRTYVWVGNRDTPVYNSNATLEISGANLVLCNGSNSDNHTIWSTGIQTREDSSPVEAKLLADGNLVLMRYNDSGDFLWQSFEHPTDTLLPGMKLRSSKVPNYASHRDSDIHLTSWKGEDDPSGGAYKCGLQTQGFTVLSTWREDTKLYRSGGWNGIEFADVPLVFNSSNQDGQTSFLFQDTTNYLYSRVTLTFQGALMWLTWDITSQEWITRWSAPNTYCDQYNHCGTNSYCSGKTCKCIKGFEPNIAGRGCFRKKPLSCDSNRFCLFTRMKLPDTMDVNIYTSHSKKSCRDMCVNNCHCTAYTVAVYQNGSLSSNCVTWNKDLVDVQTYAEAGQDLYIRLDGKKKNKKWLIIGLSVGAAAALIIIIVVVLVCIWKRKQKLARATAVSENVMESQTEEDIFGAEDTETPQLPPMDFGTILSATESFSEANEIGHGGFGTVYKGRLPSGQAIAVKRLSEISRQGTVEFKAEVMLIANLQHINLVRLLGWSVHEDERVLVYEYLENGSLHHRLFGGGQNSCELNWQRRFDIIKGIAQGLAYMQEGSRDMIIHRDLKPGNILLDRGMIPKISDFGLARICDRSERETKTTKPSGTYGYMSPEYAESRWYSTKSDIFSFGVILLEIVTGKENRAFSYTLCSTNLLSYIWTNWNDDNWEDTVDQTIRDSSSSFQKQQVRRCLEVGLLCVQQNAEDRPTMSSVLLMLVNDTAAIPSPKFPGFFRAEGHNEASITSGSLISTAIRLSSSTSRPSY